MRKKMLMVAASAATLSLAGFAASAAAMPTDTASVEVAPASEPVVDSIVAMAPGGKVALVFDSPNQTIELGESVELSFTGTNNTGNPNPDVVVVLDGCGDEAVADPGSWENVFADSNPVELSFTLSGLTTAGTCSVTVQSNHGGSNFDTTGSDTVTIIVVGGPTTTTTPAEETTTTEAESAVPVVGGNSGALAVMALGFVLVGYATIAATRRRRTA
jgi:hypothetical protein